jgi:hypothetical protein
MRILRSNKGSAVLMAVMGLMTLAGLGATTVSMMSANEASKTAMLGKEQADALAQAGIEYAKNRINLGLNPIVNDYPFGMGTFTIAAVPNSGYLAVTGNVGTYQSTKSLTTNFGANCVDLDVALAHSEGAKIVDMQITKNCLTQATITHWTFSWTPDLQELAMKLDIEQDPTITLFNDITGHSSGSQIDAQDYNLTQSTVVPIDSLEFTAPIPPAKAYVITAHLSDGSYVTKSFVDPTGLNDPTPGYEVEPDGDVAIDPGHTLSVQALCSEITYGANGPVIPVIAWLGINDTYQSLFNGSAIQGGEAATFSVQAQGEAYSIRANAHYSWFNRTYDSHDVLQVKTVINGGAVPPMQGFGGQQPVSACINQYIDAVNGTAQLLPEQVLLLFELGANMASNPTSTAADFQDLVVLLTVND